MNLQKILRRLILCEIMLLPPTLYLSLFEEQYLPPELQSYLKFVASQDWNIKDWLAIGIGFPYIVLVIGAWIALSYGSRSGRLLYTSAWIASSPISGILAPSIAGPIQASLEPLLGLVSGLILGLLYFSNLRLNYEKQE